MPLFGVTLLLRLPGCLASSLLDGFRQKLLGGSQDSPSPFYRTQNVLPAYARAPPYHPGSFAAPKAKQALDWPLPTAGIQDTAEWRCVKPRSLAQSYPHDFSVPIYR